MRGIALCGLKGAPTTVIPEGVEAVERPCPGCQRIVMLSPSTAALGDQVEAYCNDCGKTVIAAQSLINERPIELVMAPGAYTGDDQWSRRRRNELEARGFRDLTDAERADLGVGVVRPPRRVLVTHTWESQAHQYDRPDITPKPGIVPWTVPAAESHGVVIECLLAYDADRELVGILNYYPQGTPVGERPHDLLVLVNPTRRRRHIGLSLLALALRTWPEIDLLQQAYTDQGWALVSSVLRDG